MSESDQKMNSGRSDGVYENVVVRRAGHVPGNPIMTVRKIGAQDVLAFEDSLYGDVRFKKARDKPEESPTRSKYEATHIPKFVKSHSEDMIDGSYVEMRAKEKHSCSSSYADKEKHSCPSSYADKEKNSCPSSYADIDDSRIKESIQPVLARDELSDLIYEAPCNVLAKPDKPVQRSVSFEIGARESHREESAGLNMAPNKNPPDRYYQIEDAYLQINQGFYKKKSPAKSKWRLPGLGRKKDKLKSSNSLQNVSN